jgi:hypothetical protein
MNTGSVGKPKDADWRAGFVIIGADERIENVQFVRVEYVLERMIDGNNESQLPDDFADQLRS